MTTIEGTVRIPPYRFDDPLEDVAIETLNEEYIGQLDKDLGLMVGAFNIVEIGEGVLIMGDGAAYHNVVFNAIFFKPEQQEIVEGEVNDITEFGAFVKIGPMEGLVHVSQVTDDYINYDLKNSSLIGNESKKILTEGDKIRARIVTLSLKGKSIKESKIGLTMRQPNLGKFEWIEAEKNKAKENKAMAKVEE
ncbi:MAG: DNA-directed RNA polymerase [Methanobrevibacter sp.]|uniref:DNA-directed RNA polymerase n=1 Tax=Methanobrevibacter sp. TaxID=66852 RepID=UPI0025DB2C3E|nr:DNA-directed RNA polymerase [Methanobrevibacter sp.]MBQ6138278.1 DNA-directed RNA polymerase [Methanobrevibacter sp.]